MRGQRLDFLVSPVACGVTFVARLLLRLLVALSLLVYCFAVPHDCGTNQYTTITYRVHRLLFRS